MGVARWTHGLAPNFGPFKALSVGFAGWLKSSIVPLK
jgi:hypothetical protein